jgi:hypothetical protein
VRDFEGRKRKPIANNLNAMQRAFETAGIEFISGEAPGLRSRKKAKSK